MNVNLLQFTYCDWKLSCKVGSAFSIHCLFCSLIKSWLKVFMQVLRKWNHVSPSTINFILYLWINKKAKLACRWNYNELKVSNNYAKYFLLSLAPLFLNICKKYSNCTKISRTDLWKIICGWNFQSFTEHNIYLKIRITFCSFI